METLVDLYASIRAWYPALAARADEEHLRRSMKPDVILGVKFDSERQLRRGLSAVYAAS